MKNNRRKNRLIERVVDEAILVEAHELLRERRAAARWRDDEHRRAHRLSFESAEEHPIERAAARDDHPHRPIQRREEEHVSPAPEREARSEQRQVLGANK